MSVIQYNMYDDMLYVDYYTVVKDFALRHIHVQYALYNE